MRPMNPLYRMFATPFAQDVVLCMNNDLNMFISILKEERF